MNTLDSATDTPAAMSITEWPRFAATTVPTAVAARRATPSRRKNAGE
jgi:hypothetical protein